MRQGCVLCQSDQTEDVVFCGVKWRIILVDDAAFPGFCRVIWQDHVAEMTDLLPSDQHEFLTAVLAVESAVRDVMNPDKVNLASFGNMMPHLHWHVIPRFFDDTHFPESVWGKKQRAPDVAAIKRRQALLPELKAVIKKRATLL